VDPLSILKSLIVMLQGEDDPSHIAAGFALGASLGLLPKGNLFAASFFLLFFFFRVEKGMALLSALLFTPLGYLVEPAAHRIGYELLAWAPLKPLWTLLYNLPIVPWTRFNNTVVLGELILGLLLYYPLYRATLHWVARHRADWKARVDRLAFVKAIKGSSFARLYLEWERRLRS